MERIQQSPSRFCGLSANGAQQCYCWGHHFLSLVCVQSVLHSSFWRSHRYRWPGSRSIVHRPRRKVYLATRAVYYSVTAASFQLNRLALCGDINPNPGPCLNSNYKQHVSTSRSRSTLRSRDINNLTNVTSNSAYSPKTLSSRLPLSLCLINVRSIKSKSAGFLELVSHYNADLFALTETSSSSFEFSELLVKFGSFVVRLEIVYRPPSTKSFVSDCTSYLESIILSTQPILIVGDFNLHVDVDGDADAGDFLDILESKTLSSLIESHAPLKSKTVVHRPRVPWFNDSIKAAIGERRKAERKWRATKDPTHSSVFKQKKNHATLLMNQARCTYYNEFIKKNSADQGRLFKAADSLLSESKKLSLPGGSNAEAVANNIGRFFIDNWVTGIYSKLGNAVNSSVSTQDMDNNPAYNSIASFKSLSVDDVRHIIMRSSKKSCSLDPAPMSLVVECNYVNY